MAFSPFWTFLIVAVIIIAVLLILNFTPIMKRVNNSLPITTTSFPTVKPLPNPWTVSNKSGYPLDPVPQNNCQQCQPNNTCPVCQIYTFKSQTPIPAVPKLRSIPDCLQNGTCEKANCNAQGIYPSCIWPDQTSVFYGSHTCGTTSGPVAGTGCISQNGTNVTLGSTEVIFAGCGSDNYPSCTATSGNLGLIIFNWDVKAILPNAQNSFSQFFCIKSATLSNTNFLTQECDISDLGQLWVVLEYAYNGVELYQQKGGNFISIYSRETGGYLMPKGYNPNNPQLWSPVSLDTVDLTFFYYGSNLPSNPGVWWMNYNYQVSFPFPGDYSEVAPPQVVFIPDYKAVPDPIFTNSFRNYFIRTSPYPTFSIIPEKQWQDYSENFVLEKPSNPGHYIYVRNNIGIPINGTTLTLRPFTLQRNLVSDPGFNVLPVQFNSFFVEYTQYNDYVSQALLSQNEFN